MKQSLNKVKQQEITTPEQFKSLYYLLKGKRDTDIKLFDDYKQFKYTDLTELNDRIREKLKLHELVTDTTSVVVSLSNKEIKSFSNWSEFIRFDTNISATTNYITIEWDFNIILPNQTHNIPQTHTLRVRIGSGLRPSEMIQIIFQGGDENELEETQAQVVCKIDFVNVHISNELKTIVTEWYEALEENSEDHKLIQYVIRHKNKLNQVIIILFLLCGIMILNYFIYHLFSNTNLINSNSISILHKFYLISTISVLFIYIFYVIGKGYSNYILENRIRKFKRNPMFEYTKGDRNKLTEITKKNNKILLGLSRDIFIAIVVNIIVYTIGNMFPTIIKLLS